MMRSSLHYATAVHQPDPCHGGISYTHVDFIETLHWPLSFASHFKVTGNDSRAEIFQRYNLSVKRRPPYMISVVVRAASGFFYMSIPPHFPWRNRDRTPWSSSPKVGLHSFNLCATLVGSCHRSPTGSSGVVPMAPESSTTAIVEMIAVLAKLRTAHVCDVDEK